MSIQVTLGPIVKPNSEELTKLLQEIKDDAAKRRRENQTAHPNHAIQLIKKARLGALRLPEELGGAGTSIQDVFDVLIQLAAADPDVAHSLRYHFYAVEQFLLDKENLQNVKWLETIAKGNLIGNGFTELNSTNAGLFQFETNLTVDGEGYRLNGTKYFSTGTLYAEWVEIMASDINGKTVRVILPTDREGIEVVDDWDGFGQTLTGSGTTNLNHVFVEKSEVFIIPDHTTPFNAHLQLFLQAVIVGILHTIVEDAVNLLSTRTRTFSFAAAEKPTEDPQLLQVVGELSSRAFAAKAIVLAAAKELDEAIEAADKGIISYKASHQASLRAAQAKVVVDKLALEAATLLFEVGGASATRKTAHLDRHWRNIRTISSHNPTVYKARAIGNYEVNKIDLPINEVYF
ncbi:acyl-CoA dehydrogenase [Lysinibacillus macroides]|uniref:Acyl-CoA dehydrogenase n=1 Tax=Lysinibacillus macroides TaxID=33935 RepID=A0A0M9DNP1_9BACI|nr:acyl-CoA dehydrogenase family protein [Lysinibacillus macroides]KOY83862.1 acyl-CoA dehydrogenase [Lysinibacillus macroides]QPR67137.1 acyl-CoA dehydrogenase [Lysinibacillus macroides]